MFPIELINIIIEHTDLIEKTRLMRATKYLHNMVRITDLYNISEKLLQKLNDNILKCYPHVIKLYDHWNSKITDEGIKDMKLLESYALNH